MIQHIYRKSHFRTIFFSPKLEETGSVEIESLLHLKLFAFLTLEASAVIDFKTKQFFKGFVHNGQHAGPPTTSPGRLN